MRTRVSTNAYAAKRALRDRFREITADPSGLFADWVVSYGDPGTFGEGLMLYGGGVLFDQTGDEDLVDGPDTLVHEIAVHGWHIRVEQAPIPGDEREPVEATDELAEAAGDALAQCLAENPRLAGGHSVSRIVGGQCDHYVTDTSAVSVLTLRISVESDI
jgi:hypothetical protein